MTKLIQTGVRKRIGASESPKPVAIQSPVGARMPEGVESPGPEAFSPGIPQPEVQFHRRWKLRIEIIAAPRPAGLADHDRQMIERKLFKSPNGFVTQSGDRRISSLDIFGGTIQID